MGEMWKRLPVVVRVLVLLAGAASMGFGASLAFGRVWQAPERVDHLEARVATFETMLVGRLQEIQDTLGEVSSRSRRTECAVIALATDGEIDPECWEPAVRDCPALTDLATDVEALLVNTVSGRAEAWLVPIDDCYRLVALVRRHWTGMSGGELIWPEIERFFEDLRRCDGTDPNR